MTREAILSGAIRASSMALLGPRVRYMTDAERDEQVRQMIACAPRPDRVWVFGYGSLIWNPAFHFVERRTARIYGYHREFCLWSWAGRGSPQHPGLMLSLEHGGSCPGVAYRIARHKVRVELDIVWRREMGSLAYHPVWVRIHTRSGLEHAIAFTANRSHERYVTHLTEAQTARYLANGQGPLGYCRDYLTDTAAHLRELGIRDRHLERLEARVHKLPRPAPAHFEVTHATTVGTPGPTNDRSTASR